MGRGADLSDAWVTSGAASLAGHADGPGMVPPVGLLERIRTLGRAAGCDDPFAALVARAATSGLQRRGPISCGGAARLLATADGWLAASLARPDDLTSVPAWLRHDEAPPADPWPLVAEVAARRPTADLVDQGVLLGLPVAAVPEGASPVELDGEGLPVRWHPLGTVLRRRRPAPVVVDLSSLWAGPLCAHLLGRAGAEVIKVESTGRPDGARRGPAEFYDLLHTGHRAVALDLDGDHGQGALAALVRSADVVVTGARPRALHQLGLRPDRPGDDGPTVWVAITGHGWSGPGAHRVAFGDDAAAGGGLVVRGPGAPVFAGDAIADPLSGLAAAAAALAALRTGDRWLLDVALVRVAAWVAAGAGTRPWSPVDAPPRPPPPPPPRRRAAPLGADTGAVLDAL